ncbi:MAG: S8 family peptidase, partial [Candidatus Kariarchaeaceae archaeon]
MLLDRSKRIFGVIFLIFILVGGSILPFINLIEHKTDAISNTWLDPSDKEDKRVDSYNASPKADPPLANGEMRRIIQFNSFEARDNALNSLSPSKVNHIYKTLPAISTMPIKLSEISFNGVTKILDDRMIQYESSTDDAKRIRSVLRRGYSLLQTAELVGADVLRDNFGLSGAGITIAILDSGIEDHLESFDDSSGISRAIPEPIAINETLGTDNQDVHGTHVSGIAVGNGRYYSDGRWSDYDSPGMAPAASIMSIRVLNQDGFGPISDIVMGIENATLADADIISLSLSSELYEGEGDLHQLAVNNAVANNSIVVAAAGNLGPYGSGIGLPGGLTNVISVGAFDMNENDVWSNSGVGPRIDGYPGPDLLAPGVDIVSVNSKGYPSLLSGTSMATPHVSGGIALLKEEFPTATVDQIREAIVGGAVDLFDGFGKLTPVEAQGRGLLNLTRSYLILNRTMNADDSTEVLEMSVVPHKISDVNYVYRAHVSNQIKTLPFFIHSSRNVTIHPVIDNNTIGIEFPQLPPSIDVTSGLTKFNLNINITSTSLGNGSYLDLWSHIYFIENQTHRVLQNANISYFPSTNGFTRFEQSSILFDSSHDNDTLSAYFGGHSPRGQFSTLTGILEDNGHIVSEHRIGELTPQILNGYDLLILVDPDLSFTDNEIDAIQEFVI